MRARSSDRGRGRSRTPVCRWFGYASTDSTPVAESAPAEEPSMAESPRIHREPRHRDRGRRAADSARSPADDRSGSVSGPQAPAVDRLDGRYRQRRHRGRRAGRRRGMGTRRGATAADFSAYRPGFDSAMKKAGTTATFPAAPVELDDRVGDRQPPLRGDLHRRGDHGARQRVPVDDRPSRARRSRSRACVSGFPRRAPAA